MCHRAGRCRLRAGVVVMPRGRIFLTCAAAVLLAAVMAMTGRGRGNLHLLSRVALDQSLPAAA